MGRGRKPSSIALSDRYGFTVGGVIKPGRMNLTAIGFDGAILYQRELDVATDDRMSLQELLMSEVALAIAACESGNYGNLRGIGIGVAGLVDARSGVVLYCPGLPGWENIHLVKTIKERFGVEVLLDDVSRCMALAEKRHGAMKGADTFLFLYIGIGVGSGIILGNRIYRGVNGASGEFGHITVKENGPLCKCGNYGCLEALVSSGAILNRVRDLIVAGVHTSLGGSVDSSTGLTLPQVGSAALRGDKLANIIVSEIEESIGIGIADVINVFDPGTVVLAGEVVEELHGLILEGIERIARRRAVHAIAQRTVIIKSALNSDSGALGAATLVIERLLGNEILSL
ncbi:MAG: ROK family protein [Spirochaetota bacterium]